LKEFAIETQRHGEEGEEKMSPNPRAILQPKDGTARSAATSEILKELSQFTETIIGCAIEVHRQLGPGLLEQTYEAALCIELQNAGMNFVRQPIFPVVYKGQTIGEYRLDLIVQDSIVVEVKSVERFDPIFESQVLTYLRVTGKKVGLLMNFNSRLLRDGIKRYVL
jgi:GxxExxY protein